MCSITVYLTLIEPTAVVVDVVLVVVVNEILHNVCNPKANSAQFKLRLTFVVVVSIFMGEQKNQREHTFFCFGHILAKFCSNSTILNFFQQPRQWHFKNATKRDSAGAECNSGMGMLFF